MVLKDLKHSCSIGCDLGESMPAGLYQYLYINSISGLHLKKRFSKASFEKYQFYQSSTTNSIRVSENSLLGSQKQNPYKSILQDLDICSIWKELISNPERLRFLYFALSKTIRAIEEKKYSCFDAHTTSNCCHGVALFISLALSQIIAGKKFKEIQKRFKLNYLKLSSHLISAEQFIFSISEDLWVLVAAYILHEASNILPNKGRVTDPENLLNLDSKASKKFLVKLVKKLQKSFSYAITYSYQKLLADLSPDQMISENPVKDWGYYTTSTYLRRDKRGRFYAPCVYSSQVTLAFLAANKCKVAVVCDFVKKSYEKQEQYIVLLQGDGEKFIRISEDTYDMLNPKEPVFVMAGFSTASDYPSFIFKIDSWLLDLPTLILANDTYYPQFPTVSDDLQFNSKPIHPHHRGLSETLSKYSKVTGVSKGDSEFFFQNHYYIASLFQLHLSGNGKKSMLPFSPSFTIR